MTVEKGKDLLVQRASSRLNDEGRGQVGLSDASEESVRSVASCSIWTRSLPGFAEFIPLRSRACRRCHNGAAERWLSGRKRPPAKWVRGVKSLLGFESRSLRQIRVADQENGRSLPWAQSKGIPISWSVSVFGFRFDLQSDRMIVNRKSSIVN